MGFVLVIDADETKSQPGALNGGLVPMKTLGVCLPRSFHSRLERFSVNFVQILTHNGGARAIFAVQDALNPYVRDRKSTRLNSSHVAISYAVFCLKKKNYSIHGTCYAMSISKRRSIT